MWFVSLTGIYCHCFALFSGSITLEFLHVVHNEVMNIVSITPDPRGHYQSRNGLEQLTGSPNPVSEIKDSSQVLLPEDILPIYLKS